VSYRSATPLYEGKPIGQKVVDEGRIGDEGAFEEPKRRLDAVRRRRRARHRELTRFLGRREGAGGAIDIGSGYAAEPFC